MTDLHIYHIADSSDSITTQSKDNTKEGDHFLGDKLLPKVRIFDVPGLGNGPETLDEHGDKLTDDIVVERVRAYNEKTLMQTDERLSAMIWVERAGR